MSFTVDTDALVCSAFAVTGHGEDLACNHVCTDARFASAEPGWLGRSAAALDNRLARWATTSTMLLTAIGEQATAMHEGAIAYVSGEHRNAQEFETAAQA
jgi:hypothetical protein